MTRPELKRRRAQRGAVLIVSLVMLAVMTLFVISLLKTTVIELKIGGSSQVAAINLANADAAVENFISLNSGKFAPGFLTLAQGSGGPITSSLNFAPFAGTVAICPAQVSCGAYVCQGCQYGGLNLQAVQFDIKATAIGAASYGSASSGVVIHQGVNAPVGAGACGGAASVALC